MTFVTDNETVSAIIPAFNRADLVADAIDSVLYQTEPPDEIIVVDDGSTDNTLQKLDDYRPKISIITQENKGVAAARNIGIKAATCEWLAFLDSDDLWMPQKLQRQKSVLSEKPDFRICYTGEVWQRSGEPVNSKKQPQRFSGWIYKHCLPRCIIAASSVMLHRSVLDHVGYFDETLPACEDYDLWLRISHNYPVLFIPDKLIIKRTGSWRCLSEQIGLDKYRILALKKMLTRNDLSKNQRELTRRTLYRKCSIYAKGCRKHGKIKEAQWAEQIMQDDF